MSVQQEWEEKLHFQIASLELVLDGHRFPKKIFWGSWYIIVYMGCNQ